jgi:hypothetical protein
MKEFCKLLVKQAWTLLINVNRKIYTEKQKTNSINLPSVKIDPLMDQTKNFSWMTCSLTTLLLSTMLTGMAFADGRGYGPMITDTGYQVSLYFLESTKAGGNPVRVHVLDETGMPVSGAQVEINAMPVEDAHQHQKNMSDSMNAMDDMQNMPGMQSMSHAMASTPTNHIHGKDGMDSVSSIARSRGLNRMLGDYFGVITFSAPGHWQVNTHVSINGQTLDANFPVDVVSHSFSLTILAGFAGLNALIIWLASVSKRKPVTA